ncbi:uncharacterized protein FFB20_15875 [Fusarium fujikuroi]|jgi:hypothetical protein
MVKT